MTKSTLNRIFQKFNNANIKYAIFKSTDSLHAGFKGIEDLDLFISPEDEMLVRKILEEYNAIFCSVHYALRAQDRFDALILDQDKPRYYHLDIHTRIPVGLKYNKSNTFSLCSTNGFIFNDQYKIFISCAEEQLKLLICKWAFRIGFTHKATLKLDDKNPIFEEFNSCYDKSNIGDGSLDILGVPINIVQVRKSEYFLKTSELYALRKKIISASKTESYNVQFIKNFNKLICYKASRALAKFFPSFIFDRRKPISGGKLIILIGVDGSGKTTHSNMLVRRLGWKLSVRSEYLGSGDGNGWLIRRVFTAILINLKRKPRLKIVHQSERESYSILKKVMYFIIGIYSMLLGLEKLYKVLKIKFAVQNGRTVIVDRWPHSFDGGVLDGRIDVSTKVNGSLYKCISSLERSMYEKIESIAIPKKFIFLDTPFEQVNQRKPGELTLDQYEQRVIIINKLKMRYKFNKSIIDTNRPIEHVEHDVLKAAWDYIN